MVPILSILEDKDLPRPLSSMSSRYLRMTVLVVVSMGRKKRKLYKCAMHRKKIGREERRRKLIDIYIHQWAIYILVLFFYWLRNEDEEEKENVEIYHYRCSRERSNRNDARLCV